MSNSKYVIQPGARDKSRDQVTPAKYTQQSMTDLASRPLTGARIPRARPTKQGPWQSLGAPSQLRHPAGAGVCSKPRELSARCCRLKLHQRLLSRDHATTQRSGLALRIARVED